MANFEVLVERVDSVTNHPNADRLSLIKIRGFTCISAKLEDGNPRYNVGELVVYIPEGAVVPEYLLKQGFWDETKEKGILSGSKGDRVKAIKLRDIVSIGILFPVRNRDSDFAPVLTNGSGEEKVVEFGMDVADFLGIQKYEPQIPVHMAGEVFSIGIENAVKFDIENIQKYPDTFVDGESVYITEKIHGTFCAVGRIMGLNHPDAFGKNNDIIISSKGLLSQGLAFKNCEKNNDNLYVRILKESGILDKIDKYFTDEIFLPEFNTMIVFGEIFGRGVQDLTYGQTNPIFRAFDIYMKLNEGNTFYTSCFSKFEMLDKIEVESVPILYYGPYSNELVKIHRDGQTLFDGVNIREGVVITANNNVPEDRRIMKAVSPDYLTRKGNVTEFQ